MKQFFLNRNAMSIFFFSLMLTTVLFTGCKKDDENTDCNNFTSLNQSIDINGQPLTLTIAQRLVTNNFEGDLYAMQIGAFTDDCNELISMDLNITVETGSSLGGTYPIKDFFDAGVNSCYGSYATQKISPTSQSLSDLQSGTVKVTDKGNKKYNFDVSGTLVGGDKVTLKGDVQF